MYSAFEKEFKNGRFQTYDQRPGIQLLNVKQVHGADFYITCDSSDLEEAPTVEADGIIAGYDFPFPVAIKTADCLPVLILGKSGFACIHAGWRGLAAGILEKPELQQIEPCEALIGPGICPTHYEVGPDFSTLFAGNQSTFQEDGKFYFDLVKEARLSLERLKSGIHVESSGLCTWEHPKLHSYRKNQTPERNWNIFFPQPT